MGKKKIKIKKMVEVFLVWFVIMIPGITTDNIVLKVPEGLYKKNWRK